MRIGIDMYYAQYPSVFHGIGNYSFYHLSHLAEHPSIDMFFFQPIYSTLSREAYIAELSRFIIDNQLDFFHFPSPMQVPYPDVITSDILPPVYLTAMVFDLISSVFPDRYLSTEGSRIHYGKLMDLLKRMDLLLTISDYTRSDLIKFGFDPNKVFLSGFGRDDGYYMLDEADLSDMAHLFPIDKPFILAFTPSDARKNTNRLLGAFSKVIHRTNADVHLVFLNVTDEENFHQLISEYGLTRRAHSGGRVTKPQLLRLYNRALALAFPSLYEGIGLPVLEAMLCGLPVLSSNTSSLPEVTGNDAIVVDPYNEEQIAQGLEALITRADLRDELRGRGLVRALQFDWKVTAHRTVEALMLLYRLGPKKIVAEKTKKRRARRKKHRLKGKRRTLKQRLRRRQAESKFRSRHKQFKKINSKRTSSQLLKILKKRKKGFKLRLKQSGKSKEVIHFAKSNPMKKRK